MPATRFTGYADYGVGIGLRIPHYQHILEQRPGVDCFEIISENYMVEGGRPLAVLDQIIERYRVVQHDVSMYFGNFARPNRDHLKKLKALTRRTRIPWVSDHLCWGSVDGCFTHDLLPMPYTWEVVEKTARNIREVQDFFELSVAVENVSSYAEFHASEMTEWEFLNEVVGRADCGVLLDVNNIYVSSQNHGFDPFDYVNAAPALRVAQIHIAGTYGTSATSSIRTITRSFRRCGAFTSAPSNGVAGRRRCSNGTTASRVSTKCIARR